jgi:hypothetical protein
VLAISTTAEAAKSDYAEWLRSWSRILSDMRLAASKGCECNLFFLLAHHS